jgi:hypothetical protein
MSSKVLAGEAKSQVSVARPGYRQLDMAKRVLSAASYECSSCSVAPISGISLRSSRAAGRQSVKVRIFRGTLVLHLGPFPLGHVIPWSSTPPELIAVVLSATAGGLGGKSA